jgi:hypothetical protein
MRTSQSSSRVEVKKRIAALDARVPWQGILNQMSAQAANSPRPPSETMIA